MNLTRYRALADDLLQRASSDPGTQRDFLRKDIAYGEPQDSPFRPTGIDRLDRLLAALGIRWQYGGLDAANVLRFGGPSAYERAELRNFTDDEHFIRIPNQDAFVDAGEYVPTIAHEAMHWAMTRDPDIKLELGMVQETVESGEPLQSSQLSPGYIVEEIAAEIGATILLNWAGAGSFVDRADYVANYLRAVPPTFRDFAFDMAKQRALTAFEWMLNRAGLTDDPQEPDYGSDA